jgi:diguanylate cyclase (GGDEF)-like protein/PAS domain S-box-containing protein
MKKYALIVIVSTLLFTPISTFANSLFTQEERVWIETHPVVTFTGDPNWLPYEAFNAKGKYIGIVAEHLKRIEEISGLQFSPIEVQTWSEAQKIATQGKVEVISGDVADDLLNRKFKPVDPYSHNPIVIIMHHDQGYIEDLNEIKEKKIVIIKNYGYTSTIYNKYPHIRFIEVENIQEGLQGVSQGRYDAMLTTMALGSYSIVQMGIHNLNVVGNTNITMDLTLFVSKDNPILHSIINKSLKAIPLHHKHAIFNQWIAQKYIERVDYTYAITIAVFLLIIVFVTLYWALRFKNEAAKRRRLQERYKDQLELNRLYIDTSEVLLVALDTEARVTLLNKKGRELLGLSVHEVMGKNWFDLKILPEEIERQYREVFKKIITKELNISTKLEHPLVNRRGEYINFLWRNSLLVGKDGEIRGTLSSGLDITQKRIQERIVELRYKLSEMSHRKDTHALIEATVETIKSIGNSKEGFFRLLEKEMRQQHLLSFTQEPLIDNLSKNNKVIVPIVRNNKMVALIGLSQKDFDYTAKDIQLLQQIGDITYDYLERIHAEKKIEKMAFYDALTKLPNRVFLSNQIDEAIKIHLKRGNFFALCFLDLDGFKPVNDSYGHHIGDKLLIDLAKRLTEYLNDDDLVSRIGGDEFVVVLSNLDNQDDYIPFVKEILALVDKPFSIDKLSIHVSASIGVTLFPSDTSDTDELLRHADQAMYQAKESGRSKYKLYRQNTTGLDINKKLFGEFDVALKKNQLALHYQPKISLSTGSVIGFEALIRWKHPHNGTMFPQEFLYIIKDTPLELILDQWVIVEAFRQKHYFNQQGENYSISININPRSMHLDSFYEFVAKELSHYPSDFAKGIELEILEISKIQDTDKVVNTMHRLKKLGIIFSLDDFGTGYASLVHFHKLPIEVLKIDQKFIQSMLKDVESLNLIESILNLATKLKRPVVAEGVESIEVAMILLSLGCQYAQGYAISEPLPTEQIEEWLKQWSKDQIWHNLANEVPDMDNIYDVDLIVLVHKQWLKDTIKYVKEYPKNRYIPDNEQDCKFTQWYDGVGNQNYHGHPNFAKLKTIHTELHNISLKILGQLQSNLKEQALEQIESLHYCSNELTQYLYSLKNN